MDNIPTIGRIVHYTFKNRSYNVVTRPAIIVDVQPTGTVNVLVFLNGSSDYEVFGNTMFKQFIKESQVPLEDTWMWPSKVQKQVATPTDKVLTPYTGTGTGVGGVTTQPAPATGQGIAPVTPSVSGNPFKTPDGNGQPAGTQ